MLRELIDQIELEKLAGQDPYSEVAQAAFFDELELIKQAGWFKDVVVKPVARVLKGKSQQAAKAPKPLVMKFKGNRKAVNEAMAPKTDARGITTTTFADQGGKYRHRRSLSIEGLT